MSQKEPSKGPMTPSELVKSQTKFTGPTPTPPTKAESDAAADLAVKQALEALNKTPRPSPKEKPSSPTS